MPLQHTSPFRSLIQGLTEIVIRKYSYAMNNYGVKISY